MPQHHIMYQLPAESADLESAMAGEKWKAVVVAMLDELNGTETKDEFIDRDDLKKKIMYEINNLGLKI